MTRLWFAAKRYGYGWYPVSWEGWVVVIGHVLLILAAIPVFDHAMKTGVNENIAIAGLIVWVCSLTAIMIRICVVKGEKARWRWGK